MSRIFSLFLTTCFLIWILPLGAFIKGSMEKMACNGQRAFHMCTHMLDNNGSLRTPSKITAFNQLPQQNAAKSSTSTGTDFLLLDLMSRFRDKAELRLLSISNFYLQSYFPSIDHPPKLSFSF